MHRGFSTNTSISFLNALIQYSACVLCLVVIRIAFELSKISFSFEEQNSNLNLSATLFELVPDEERTPFLDKTLEFLIYGRRLL